MLGRRVIKLINTKNKRKVYILFLFFLMIFSAHTLFAGIYGGIASEFNISLGDRYIFNSHFPFYYTLDSKSNNILEIAESDGNKNIAFFSRAFELSTLEKGSAQLQLKLLGLVPFRNIRVNIVPEIRVIPGGQSIGVKLNTNGVLVVGFADITDEDGNTNNISIKSGIKTGDSLIAINNQKVNDAVHVADLIKESGGDKLKLTFLRDSETYNVSISPIKSAQDQEYRLGLWVRDKTAGVGTMTFYDPESKIFGALGHAITDIDTGSLLSVKDGEIVKSRIVSVQEGKRGAPGEIRGSFHENSKPIGTLKKNTEYGIYGKIIKDLGDGFFNKPIPVAYQHEIKEGTAHILTTNDENKIEKYEIEILRINNQSKPDSKSMVIRITDHRLLYKTGGIIQGMSGSPIIQNGKLVGAVTHVLINNPEKGYGIFIEWMLEQSGIFDFEFKKAVE